MQDKSPAVLYRVSIILVLLLFAGCALSPQVLSVNPDIDVQGGTGQALALRVEVVDGRSSPLLGQRGGVYKDTSDISTGENFTASLKNSLVKALQKQGYSVVDSADATQLKVVVNSIKYVAHSEKLLNKIEIAAEVRAVVNRNNREFTGDYKANRKKDYVKLPSVEENEKLVNEVLALVLKSMLSDDDLIKFIGE